ASVVLAAAGQNRRPEPARLDRPDGGAQRRRVVGQVSRDGCPRQSQRGAVFAVWGTGSLLCRVWLAKWCRRYAGLANERYPVAPGAGQRADTVVSRDAGL